MEDLAPVIGPVGVLLVLGWILKLFLTHRRRVTLSRLQYDLQTKLLDKFSSSQELAEYLHGDAGERFLQSATVERSDPHARILGSVQAGLVLLTGGIAFLALEGRISGADEAFAFLGTLGVALGVGFGLSAGVAYLLSKAWGLINGGGSAGRPPESS
jgi:small-conductance mechanosensitive channel